MNALQDNDINVRRVALVTFNSAAHNKPSLVRDLLLPPIVETTTNGGLKNGESMEVTTQSPPSLINFLYNETKVSISFFLLTIIKNYK